jgi:nitroreductase
MDFADVLSRRRMVRNYTEDAVPDDVLTRVAAAALRAPSAGNSQAIGVVIVTDADRRAEIARLGNEPVYVEAGFDPWISKAPAHIIISVSEKVYRDRYSEPDKLGPNGERIKWPVPYWWVDAGAAMMAVLLAAVDEGLAAGFLGVHSMPDLARLVRLPGHFHPIGVITIGYPARDRRSTSLNRPKKAAADLIHRDVWG